MTTLSLNAYLDSDKQPSSYGRFEVTVPGPFTSIEQMERQNIVSGGHYFDKSAKRFFRSRIYDGVFYGRFFIDSIQFESSRGERAPRQYKIRAMHDNGSTNSVIATDESDIWREDFPSLDSAKRALKRLVEASQTRTEESEQVTL